MRILFHQVQYKEYTIVNYITGYTESCSPEQLEQWVISGKIPTVGDCPILNAFITRPSKRHPAITLFKVQALALPQSL